MRLAAALLAAAAISEGHARSGPDLAPAVPAFTVPAGGAVVKEARYRMSAGIRPLLVFWIRTNNVGGARIVWHEGDGTRGWSNGASWTIGATLARWSERRERKLAWGLVGLREEKSLVAVRSMRCSAEPRQPR